MEESSIVVVSGLPRSGTSLVMQMLAAGGLPVLTDGQREADEDNPNGYWEYESVKRLETDATWVPQATGKVVKVIPQLLCHLPATHRYRVFWIERDLREVIRSQAAMLARRGEAGAGLSEERMLDAYRRDLAHISTWLRSQPQFCQCSLSYADLLDDARQEAMKMAVFVGQPLAIEAMTACVDLALYRHRYSPAGDDVVAAQ